jgi:hypothetical protein
MAAGGDGYVMFKKALSSYETSLFQRDALIEYIKSLGYEIEPMVRGRIQIVN